MGRNRLFTDEQFIEALEEYDYDVYSVATALECTQATVWLHAKRLQINFTARRYSKTIENQMPLFQAFKGPVTIAQVAASFSLPTATAYRLLRGAIELYWGTEHPPIWPAPANVPEIKVFHYFSTPPEGTRGWDDDDDHIAEALHLKPQYVAAYRTRCTTMPTPKSIPITRQIRERNAMTNEVDLTPQQVDHKSKVTMDPKQKVVNDFTKRYHSRKQIPSKISNEQKAKSLKPIK